MRGAIREGADARQPPARAPAPIDRTVLGCVVTGYAKGGTTLVKDLVCQTTEMVSGFEGGFLLTDAPSLGIREPHAAILRTGWGLDPDFEAEYRLCRTHEEGYRLLRSRARVLAGTRRPLVDKLPQYMPELPGVMRRAPGTPVIVALRDPLHVAVSWVQQGQRMEATVQWMRAATDGFLQAARDEGSMPALYVCNVSDVVAGTDAELARIQHWLGLPERSHDPAERLGLDLHTTSTRRKTQGGIERDRHDMPGRCPPAQLEEIRLAVEEAIPERPHLAAYPSGHVKGPRERHAMVGPADLWESKRSFQFEFLSRHGLRASDHVLDIGCGTLRGGIPIIRHLESGRYVGIDVRPEAIREAHAEILHHGLSGKKPALAGADALEAGLPGRSFDVAWAFSTLIHTDDETLERTLRLVRAHLRHGGNFYGNVNVGAHEDSHWRGLPLVSRPMEHYRRAFGEHGLRVEDIGSLEEFGHEHPRRTAAERSRQRMLRATVMGS